MRYDRKKLTKIDQNENIVHQKRKRLNDRSQMMKVMTIYSLVILHLKMAKAALNVVHLRMNRVAINDWEGSELLHII
jgi:hypothetical protein